MINLPTQAQVYCSDGIAGISTYVIANPINQQVTHLVVKCSMPPFQETLVPLDQVEATSPNQINLKCTQDDLKNMEPFVSGEYIRTKMSEEPTYLYWPYLVSETQWRYPELETFVYVKHHNVPQGGLAVHRGARVEATDGYVGLVDELLINSNNLQVTHLVLLQRHLLDKWEITIPVSQIDRVLEDTIYLKLDRQEIEMLPTTPVQRWPRQDSDKARE